MLMLFKEALDKIDLAKHERYLPVCFLDGYYRNLPEPTAADEE